MEARNATSWSDRLDRPRGRAGLDYWEETNAVEANEVMLRIVWRHRWLLVITTLLPIAVVLPLRLTQPVTYTATANVQAQVAAPQASTQVASILSQVSAIATSPAVVQKAIDAAKVDRNAFDVAKNEISSTSLDSSAIVAVSVKDPNRQVALRLSQKLASAIVSALNAPGTAASQQLATLTHQESQLDSSRANLLTQLNTAQLSHLATTDPQVQALITELAGVEAQLSANQAAQQQVISSSNGNQDASVISEPSAATVTAASKQVAVYAALAGLLGLIVGLLIATIAELARPTVAEPESGARELGVAFLGNAEIARVKSKKAKTTGGGFTEEVSTEGELTERKLTGRGADRSGGRPRDQAAPGCKPPRCAHAGPHRTDTTRAAHRACRGIEQTTVNGRRLDGSRNTVGARRWGRQQRVDRSKWQQDPWRCRREDSCARHRFRSVHAESARPVGPVIAGPTGSSSTCPRLTSICASGVAGPCCRPR